MALSVRKLPLDVEVVIAGDAVHERMHPFGNALSPNAAPARLRTRARPGRSPRRSSHYAERHQPTSRSSVQTPEPSLVYGDSLPRGRTLWLISLNRSARPLAQRYSASHHATASSSSSTARPVAGVRRHGRRRRSQARRSPAGDRSRRGPARRSGSAPAIVVTPTAFRVIAASLPAATQRPWRGRGGNRATSG